MVTKKKTTKKSTAIAKGGPAASMLAKAKKMAGAGNEEVTQDDILLSALILLQSNSPQLIKKSDAYVEGSSAGDMINSVTRENYGDELIFVPITFNRTYREHKPREADGRLGDMVAEHDTYDMSTLEENEKGIRCLAPETGNEIVQCANNLVVCFPNATWDESKQCLVMDDDKSEPIMIRMRMTKWRAAKQLNTLCKRLVVNDGDNKYEAPRFAGYYKLSSIFVEGDNDYFNYEVSYLGWCSEEHFASAEDFYTSVKGKTVKTVGDDEEVEAGSSEQF